MSNLEILVSILSAIVTGTFASLGYFLRRISHDIRKLMVDIAVVETEVKKLARFENNLTLITERIGSLEKAHSAEIAVIKSRLKQLGESLC